MSVELMLLDRFLSIASLQNNHYQEMSIIIMMMMIITKYENAELSEGPNAHCCITCLITQQKALSPHYGGVQI